MRKAIGTAGLWTLLAWTVAGPAPARAQTTWKVDPVHSQVLFRVLHLNIGHVWGWFRQFEGTVVLDAQRPEGNRIEFSVDAASVDTRDEKRDQHLRGPDFFNAKQAPKWSFRSRTVKPAGADSYEVSGDLTLRGVTKPVTFTARKVGEGKDPWGSQRVGFSARFPVDRSAFGISYMPEGLGREVEVFVDFEAILQK
ncbi:YceI family protein [Myxococcota bacterium]|jgi:polyisoprenoid-binding protein YceI|nr:YceI family protein [Myxococcota bacterium]